MLRKYKYTEEEVIEIFKSVVSSNTRFTGYQKTQDIYKFWWSIYTGLGHDTIFETMFDIKKPNQKKKEKKVKYIYNPSSPKLVNKAISTYSHIHRVDNILDSFDITGTITDKDPKKKKITGDLDCFYGTTSARQYLSERIIHWNVYDPNSYLMINFEMDKKTVHPYPIHIPSKNVIDREYKHGTLQYLIYESNESCKIKKGDKIEPGTKCQYWCITRSKAYRITVCDKDTIGVKKQLEAVDDKELKTASLLKMNFQDDFLEKMKFQSGNTIAFQESFELGLEEMPAIAIGYVRTLPDEKNHCDDHIYESLLYPAKSAFLESIKRKRHKDLHLELHGIAQKFAFVPACKWKSKKDGLSCNGGVLENQQTCPACKGSAVQSYHSDEQDIISIPIKDLTKDQYLALKDLTYYQQIDFQVIDLNVKEYEKAEYEVLQAIANAPIFDNENSKDRVEKTKYEVQSNRSVLNTVLHKFGKQDEIVYKHIVRSVSGYNDVKPNQINNKFQYPNDFALENVSDLVLQLEGLGRSDGPELAKLKIKTKIMHKLCVDDSKGFEKWKAREFHRPFRSYTIKERSKMLGMLPALNNQKILYLYFDRIFNEIELESYAINNSEKDRTVEFYELPLEQQIQLVDAAIIRYIEVFKTEFKATESIGEEINDPEPIEE